MFQYNTLIEYLRGTFKGCLGLTGNGWSTIISNATSNVPTVDGTNCFFDCFGLTNYTLIPADWVIATEPNDFDMYVDAVAVKSYQIDLTWSAPYSDGGRVITGYKIERESPIGGGFSVLVENTANQNLTYSDITCNEETEYNYRVSARNVIGLGSPSYEGSATTPIGTAFVLRIAATSDNFVFTLPLVNGGSYDFTVDWGDGTTPTHITAYNVGNTHTYVTHNNYTVSITGNSLTKWSQNNAGTKAAITSIISFKDMNTVSMDFYGCLNLQTIPSNMNRLTHLTTALNMFRDCVRLGAIPSGIFDGSVGILSFQQTFAGAFVGSSHTIPADLFKYNVNVTSFSQTFYGCTLLTGAVPTDLFRYNTLVTDMSYVFRQCGITSIPADLFRYNTLVTAFLQSFNGCSALTSLPTDLFRYNILATTFVNVFTNCSLLASVCPDLFRYNTACTNFTSAFNGCLKLQLASDIFYRSGEAGTRFLNKSINFTNCFTRTSFSGVQGVAPDLWNVNFGTGTPTRTSCYSGGGNSLTSLSNYASIPTNWKS